MADSICRCKFRLKAVRTEMKRRYDHEKEERYNEKLYDLEFTAVSKGDSPDSENTRFWESTPEGSFHFKTVEKEVAEQFELNDTYYVDFTPTPE